MNTHLYERGFLITNSDNIGYKKSIPGSFLKELNIGEFSIVLSENAFCYFTEKNDKKLFIIGHAYNPVRMIDDENAILKDLSETKNDKDFFQLFSELTGIFTVGIVENDSLLLIGDPAGMQCVFYGYHDGYIFVSSHTRLLEDVCGVEFDPYVTELINYRFYPLFGRQLPGDITPYKEFRRMIPNHYVKLSTDGAINVERFFPFEEYKEYSEAEAKEAEKRIAELMHNNMDLISRKWKRPAISMTGGCDSKTTLACANGFYDRFSYFSYTSSDAESADADAARLICNHLGLEHVTYEIPKENISFPDIDTARRLLEINSGCIGKTNANDIRKRVFFAEKDDFDVEVKSWVSEIGRAYYSKRFLKKRFPEKPTSKYLTVMYKVFFNNRRLVKKTNLIFDDYIEKYLSFGLRGYPWQEIFFWEFRMSSWNGLVITGEHKYSFDITIPYNNRLIIDMLLRMPLDYRINDTAYKEIRQMMNPGIDEAGIDVINVKHTKHRAKFERMYLEVMSKIPF